LINFFSFQCDSHIGYVFKNGPAPFFKKILVNSASIYFEQLEDFESPEEKTLKKNISDFRKQKNLERHKSFVFVNQVKNNQEVIEYFANNYLKDEYESDFKTLGKKLWEIDYDKNRI
jgi:hypothetical protein